MQSYQEIEKSISGVMADCAAMCDAPVDASGPDYAGDMVSEPVKPNYPEIDGV